MEGGANNNNKQVGKERKRQQVRGDGPHQWTVSNDFAWTQLLLQSARIDYHRAHDLISSIPQQQ